MLAAVLVSSASSAVILRLLAAGTRRGAMQICVSTNNHNSGTLEWRNGTFTGMIFTMLIRCLSFKRLMAAMLPLSLTWVLVACVSICARESTDGHSNNQFTAPMEVSNASDCQGCPLTSFPKARIPERAIQGTDPQKPVAVAPLNLSINPCADGVALVSWQRQRSSTDPPIERLTPLRI